jgi:V8-like Glu-specific endopeptidase
MSQKEQVEEMLKAGKGYDEIEDQTGSTRSYIRSIAVGYRKRAGEGEKEETETRQPETHETEHAETAGMNFYDDNPKTKTEHKSGREHHKAWVKAAKYECGTCGATIGKTESFCPHCGETLVWEGIE